MRRWTQDRHADCWRGWSAPTAGWCSTRRTWASWRNPGSRCSMRKYRLHGLAARIAAAGGVVHLEKFAPASRRRWRTRERQDYVAGKDSAAGFVNLLRRNIAPRDLLHVCFAEWKKSGWTRNSPRARRHGPRRRFKRKMPCRPKTANPIATYQKICPVKRHGNHAYAANQNLMKHMKDSRSPRAGAAGSRQGHHRPAEVMEKALIAIFTGHHALDRGRAGRGQNAARAHARARARLRVSRASSSRPT